MRARLVFWWSGASGMGANASDKKSTFLCVENKGAPLLAKCAWSVWDARTCARISLTRRTSEDLSATVSLMLRKGVRAFHAKLSSISSPACPSPLSSARIQIRHGAGFWGECEPGRAQRRLAGTGLGSILSCHLTDQAGK